MTTGVRRVETGRLGRAAEADEDPDGRVDSQQGRVDDAAQQADAGERRAAAAGARPRTQPRHLHQEQVAGPAETRVHADQTRRRDQSKKLKFPY